MTARIVVAPREVVAYVVKRGSAYLYDYIQGDWTNERAEASRWKPDAESGHGARTAAGEHGGRVVALVRREPRDWAKLVEEHAALTARVASLADVEADRDRLRLACDAIAEERDAWKARAEAAEGRYERLLTEAVRIDSAAEERIRADERAACAAWLCEGHQGSLATAMLRARGKPAPARVLRDGEGGCEPLPTPPKPQPAAGLYALSEVGYVLTRRGCDLLDALARKP